MLAFVFLPAISGDSRCSALAPLTNTVLLLGAPTANVNMGKDLDIFALGNFSFY
jgi:hypothetical protein